MEIRSLSTALLALGVLLLLLFFAGCSSTPIYFDEFSDGKTITIAKGTSVAIRLRENPATGYTWLTALPDGLSMVRDQYIPDTMPPGMVGSGGAHLWTVRAERAGTFTFKAVSIPPGMQVTGGEQTYTLTIIAK